MRETRQVGGATTYIGTAADGTSAQTDAFASLANLLNQYGLGTLTNWAWDQIVLGRSPSQVTLDLYQRPEFNARFPAIAARQQAGLPPISPAEYIAYENQAFQMLRMNGMPPGFYDSPQDFSSFIAGNVSLAELSARISSEGYLRVANAPPEVRDAFARLYGAQGDAALASVFLDPERSTPELQRMAAAADLAGRGTDYGLNFNRTGAEGLVDAGVTTAAAQAGFARLQQLDPLFTETINEKTNLTAEQQGVAAVFGLGDASALDKRQQDRAAMFQAGGGALTGAAGTGEQR